jgi:alpha-ketoglutarate-dependent taurine dioxygenase
MRVWNRTHPPKWKLINLYGCGFQGYLSVNFSDNYYIGSQRFPEVPRLTDAQFEAMDLFNQLAASPELKISYMLQPGDIQLLSNHTVLHHREAFRNGSVCPSSGPQPNVYR